MTTKLEQHTGSYNQRRYSKPWIARVTFAADGKTDFTWGTWIGDARTGSEGLLVIEAAEGDIVASGQKDFRGNNGGTDYYQVRDGKLVKLAGRLEAYQLATAVKS